MLVPTHKNDLIQLMPLQLSPQTSTTQSSHFVIQFYRLNIRSHIGINICKVFLFKHYPSLQGIGNVSTICHCIDEQLENICVYQYFNSYSQLGSQLCILYKHLSDKTQTAISSPFSTPQTNSLPIRTPTHLQPNESNIMAPIKIILYSAMQKMLYHVVMTVCIFHGHIQLPYPLLTWPPIPNV